MTSLLILAVLAQDTNAFFPDKVGSATLWGKLEAVGDKKFQVVRLSDKGAEYKPIEGKNWRVLKGFGAVEYASDEFRFYTDHMDGLLGRTWTIKSDLKAGLKWKAETIYLSCGFGSHEENYATSVEKVTVPAGTFDAIRVDIAHEERVHTSLWFARGKGLVKMKQGDQVYELAN